MWTAAIQVAASILNQEEYNVVWCSDIPRLNRNYSIITNVLERHPLFKQQTTIAVQSESSAVVITQDKKSRYIPEDIYKHGDAKERILVVNSLVMEGLPHNTGIGNLSAETKSDIVKNIADWILERRTY